MKELNNNIDINILDYLKNYKNNQQIQFNKIYAGYVDNNSI